MYNVLQVHINLKKTIIHIELRKVNAAISRLSFFARQLHNILYVSMIGSFNSQQSVQLYKCTSTAQHNVESTWKFEEMALNHLLQCSQSQSMVAVVFRPLASPLASQD